MVLIALRNQLSSGATRTVPRSVSTSAGFRSGQWSSGSEHSVPMLGAASDQCHLSGHPWRPVLSIALQPDGLIGRGPGLAQLAPPAKQALDPGDRRAWNGYALRHDQVCKRASPDQGGLP